MKVDFVPPVVILAAGDYPMHSEPRRLLEEAATVVCLDSAADAYCNTSGRLPELVVGDGDSISPTLRHRLAERFVSISEQDTNDLCKAVRYLHEQGVGEAIILGATGKREDHTIGNIFHLADLSKLIKISMVTDYGVFLPCHGKRILSVRVGTQISVFNVGAHSFHAEGLRWPLYDFKFLWEGTLNEAIAPTVEIEAQGDYIVYIAHEA